MAVLGVVVSITVLGNPVGATYKEESKTMQGSLVYLPGRYLLTPLLALVHRLSDLQELGEEATHHTEVCIQQAELKVTT